MIKRIELRSGNLFADQVGGIRSVAGIHEDCIVIEYFRAASSDFTPGGQGDSNQIWPTKSISFENALPIPLTEEWLVRLGFKTFFGVLQQDCLGMHSDSYGYLPLFSSRDEWEPTGAKALQYVHQLQNLFFALTGEELTIKQPA